MMLINGQLTSKSGYLPTEVLSNIFEECLELDDFECTVPQSHQAPLVLTWVCRLWRTIALNTHRLWRGLALVREADRINDSRRLLELWIERSGALPFGVRLANILEDDEPVFSIDAERKIDQFSANGLRAFTDMLLKCSKRWRVLEVVVPDISYATTLLDAVTSNARGMEHLCIAIQHLGSVNQSPYRYDFTQNTSLQSVRLVTPHIVPFPNGNNQSFMSLTELELHFCESVENCLTWIDMIPNLEQLRLRLFSTGQQRSIFHPGRHTRRLPHLTNLEVTCFEATSQADDPSSLLDMLELPALTDFELDLNHLFDASPFPRVRDLIVRSGANLESLCLSGTHMSEAEIVECLRLSPDLEWFEIEFVSDGILRALTPCLVSEERTVDGTTVSLDQISEDSTESNGSNSASHDGNNVDQPSSIAEDSSRYTVMCPQLHFFETEDVGACSLQVLYAMMVSRCEDIYKDLLGYVDTSAVEPTPDAFKTLCSIVLPCDPLYNVLSHPQILDSLERTLYF